MMGTEAEQVATGTGRTLATVHGNLYDIAHVCIERIARSWLGLLAILALAGLAFILAPWPRSILLAIVVPVATVGTLGIVYAIVYRFTSAPEGWLGGLTIDLARDGLRVEPSGASPPAPYEIPWQQVEHVHAVGGHRIVHLVDGSVLVLARSSIQDPSGLTVLADRSPRVTSSLI